MTRLDTEKPVKPALGLAPRPVAPSSRISPPEPVAAPGNGEIRGWVVMGFHFHLRYAHLHCDSDIVHLDPQRNGRLLNPSITAALSL